MAVKVKQITNYKGRYCAELENGLFVLENGSMGLLLCEKVDEGMKVMESNICCGMMSKTEDDFRWNVENANYMTDMSPYGMTIKDEDDDEQVKISVTITKGHIVEELRKLADAIEDNDYEEIPYYETYHCAAEFH
jgi:hypothetical protein